MSWRTLSLLYRLSPTVGDGLPGRSLHDIDPDSLPMSHPPTRGHPRAAPVKLTVLIHGDVVAALCEDGLPLKAQLRPVLTTAKGGVVTLAKAWMGKQVVVVEVPPD